MTYSLTTSYYVAPEPVMEKILEFAKTIPEASMPICKGNGTIEFEVKFEKGLTEELFHARVLERLRDWLQSSEILTTVSLYKDAGYILSYRKRK